MTAAWPATVPQYAQQPSYSEKPERNAAEFRPEIGPPLSRRRTSISSDVIRFETTMTFDQYDDLLEFYREDLKDGTVSFTRKHPRDTDGPDRVFRFTAEPEFRAAGPDYGVVSLQVRLMPSV